jgi:hypothetical protein
MSCAESGDLEIYRRMPDPLTLDLRVRVGHGFDLGVEKWSVRVMRDDEPQSPPSADYATLDAALEALNAFIRDYFEEDRI